MAEIICYRCFASFPSRQLHFKCLLHAGGGHVFPWRPGPLGVLTRRPPQNAMCPRDYLFTGFRVCPHCQQDLPYYVGRTPQRIVAVTGCRATGKTVFLWALLHQLRERLPRQRATFATAMFEDDGSFEAYHGLSHSLLVDRVVPEATQVSAARMGQMVPMIVRVLSGERRQRAANVVLYDPAGELFENLEEVRYLRYLSRSAAIIYLLDAPDDDIGFDERARAADGLAALIKQVREELQVKGDRRLPQSLAIAITKSDRKLFDGGGKDRLVANVDRDPGFWTSWNRASRTEVDSTSAACEEVLRRNRYDNLVNLARMNFAQVRYFAVSSLGREPNGGFLDDVPEPIGVENPLFWILNTLG